MAPRGDRETTSATLEGISREAKRRRSKGENGTQYESEGKGRADLEVVMLGQRQETPRWANGLAWQVEMLGWRRGKPRWEDELVW